MHADVADCIWHCSVCQWDKPPTHPKKSYIGWTKVAHHLLAGASTWWDHFHETKMETITSSLPVDPFSKWVEIHAMPSLHSWRVAKFLYNDLVAHWGKLHYVQTDNGAEFAGSFAWLCKGLGIVHHHITIGNSKANGQVEQTIRILKDCIWHGLTKAPTTFWMNHLALALLLLCMTVSRMMGISAISLSHWPTTIVTKHGHPRTTVPAQPANLGQGRSLSRQSQPFVEQLQGLGGNHIKEAEQRI